MRAFALFAAAIFLLLAGCASESGGGEGGAPGAGAGQQTGDMCGGIAGFQCGAEGDYCALEPGVCRNTADAAGVCKPKPQACTMDYRPVCGCDGNTYGNACAAAGAGVSVASEGECS